MDMEAETETAETGDAGASDGTTLKCPACSYETQQRLLYRLHVQHCGEVRTSATSTTAPERQEYQAGQEHQDEQQEYKAGQEHQELRSNTLETPYKKTPTLKGLQRSSEPIATSTPNPQTLTPKSTPTPLPEPAVRRNYSCRACPYRSSRARAYLEHRRSAHGERVAVYPCARCHYASAARSKLARHLRLVHKVREEELRAEIRQEGGAEEGQGWKGRGEVRPEVGKEQRLEKGIELEEGIESEAKDYSIGSTEAYDKCIGQPDANDSIGEYRKSIGSPQTHHKSKSRSFGNPETNDANNNMADENQNEVTGDVKKLAMEEMVVEEEVMDEDDDYEDVDEEISFKSVEKRKYLGENFHPKPSENAYEYILSKNDDNGDIVMFQCCMCPFENSYKHKVATHIRAVHMKKALFKCPYCDFVCQRKIEWCVHKTSHTNKFVFSCDECLYRTTMRRNFDRHIAKHRNGGPIKCPRCSYSSTGESAIQRHIADYHASPDKEKENVRHEESFNTAGGNVNLNVARSSSSELSPFKSQDGGGGGSGEYPCDECAMQFRTEAKLRQHMIAHSNQAPHACPVCGLAYKRPADLNRHMKRKHNVALQDYRRDPAILGTIRVISGHEELSIDADADNSLPSPSHSTEYDTTLNDLNDSSDYQPLNLSVKQEVMDEVQDEPLDLSTPKKSASGSGRSIIPTQPREFGCHMCDSSYRYRSDLAEHLRVIHYVHVEDEEEEEEEAGEGEWRLHCQYCPFRGSYAAEVERHTREMHSGGGGSGTSVGDGDSTKKKNTNTTAAGGQRNGLESVSGGSGVGGTAVWGDCVFCPFRAAWKCDMRRHLQRHHVTEVQMCAGGDLDAVLAQTYTGGTAPETSEANAASRESSHTQTHHASVGFNSGFNSSTEVNLTGGGGGSIAGGTNSSVLKCPACPFTCSDAASLSRHGASHHDNLRRFLCAHCGRRCNWLWQVRKHIRSSHPGASLDVVELPEEEARATLKGYLEGEAGEKEEAGSPTKATDRCRPYMCSECGRRSNWRWDMNKHIRSLHPVATLVTLSEQEARDTFDEYERSLQQQSMVNNHAKAVIHRTGGGAGAAGENGDGETDETKQLVLERLRPFKCSTCGKRSNWRWDLGKHIKTMHRGQGSIVVMSAAEARASIHQHEIQQLRQELGKSHPSSSGSPTLTPAKRPAVPSTGSPGQSHIDVSKLKRFKCSVCAYRSNFRSDIGRHIKRKHQRGGGGGARVTQLAADEAAATLAEYHQVWARKKFVPTPLTPTPDAKRPRLSGPSASPTPTPTVRALAVQWACGRCDGFRHDARSAVEAHVAEQHPPTPEPAPLTPCMCKECGDTFPTHTALRTHARTEHDEELEEPPAAANDDDKDKESQDVKSVSEWREVAVHEAVVQYRCRRCGITAGRRAVVQEHAAQQHPGDDDTPAIDQFYTVRGGSERCPRCPFTAPAPAILQRHLEFHTPQPAHPYKCPFCPYWVSQPAALNHHMRLHANNEGDEEEGEDEEDGEEVGVTGSPKGSGSRSRHYCEYCPYVSANRNDYLYHKQFHRPKPAAPFKCDQCQYWVSLRRLLKQHAKVHTAEYQARYRRPHVPGPDMTAVLSTSGDDGTALSTDEVLELAVLKQQIIASKVTSVAVTPDKVQGEGYIPRQGTPVVKFLKLDQNGVFSRASFRTMLKCRFCPYRNVRATNLRLHEKMHGDWGSGDTELLKCPYCDYHVGNAGVLARHIKVHSEGYDPSQDDINEDYKEILNKTDGESEEDEEELPMKSEHIKEILEASEGRVRAKAALDAKDLPGKCDYFLKESSSGDEVTLEKATLQKLCCERCPYATVKRAQFEKHTMLHGSKQRYTCEYCDYSVPAYHLLLQHKRLHLMPNHNLLAAQSLGNLQKLPVIAADVALAGRLGGSDSPGQDHSTLDLYENSGEFVEPRGPTFRCDKCPYQTARRGLLLQHLKCHLVRAALHCPYCSYSVGRTHLLNQHLRLHFSAPGSEMCALGKGAGGVAGAGAEAGGERYIHLTPPRQRRRSNSPPVQESTPDATADATADATTRKTLEADGVVDVEMQMANDVLGDGNDSLEIDMDSDVKNISDIQEMQQACDLSVRKRYVCEFCEREFLTKEHLIRHESQHTVGSGCE